MKEIKNISLIIYGNEIMVGERKINRALYKEKW